MGLHWLLCAYRIVSLEQLFSTQSVLKSSSQLTTTAHVAPPSSESLSWPRRVQDSVFPQGFAFQYHVRVCTQIMSHSTDLTSAVIVILIMHQFATFSWELEYPAPTCIILVAHDVKSFHVTVILEKQVMIEQKTMRYYSNQKPTSPPPRPTHIPLLSTIITQLPTPTNHHQHQHQPHIYKQKVTHHPLLQHITNIST